MTRETNTERLAAWAALAIPELRRGLGPDGAAHAPGCISESTDGCDCWRSELTRLLSLAPEVREPGKPGDFCPACEATSKGNASSLPHWCGGRATPHATTCRCLRCIA